MDSMVERILDLWFWKFEKEEISLEVLSVKKPISCLSLYSEECYNEDATLDLEIKRMKFKIKEKEVLREHKNEITRPTIKYNCWKTRVKGAKNNQIIKL